MDEDEIRQARFERVKAAYNADSHALTILRARRYLARYPEHGYAWYLLGASLRCLARYDEAEEALATALRLCPEDRKRIPLGDLGHLERQRGDYERAAGWYRKAIEAAPEMPRATSTWVPSWPNRDASARQRRSTGRPPRPVTRVASMKPS